MHHAAGDSRDLLSDRFATVIIYGVPVAALVVSGFFNVSNAWRGAIWAIALASMGVGCLVNALRCGRVHCYATGPFFVLMAVVALFFGFDAPPRAHGWNTIALVTLTGGIVLYFVPELFFGRYLVRPLK